MKKFLLPFLSVAFALMTMAVAAELKDVNLSEMGMGSYVVGNSIPAPTAAEDGR